MSEVEIVEKYEFSDDEDEFNYEAIPDAATIFEGEDDDDNHEDFAIAMDSIQRGSQRTERDAGVLTQVRPSVVDDFVRNFLIKVGMSRTLDTFNSEWYELQSKGKLAEEYTSTVPDIYVRNQELDEQVAGLQTQLEKMRQVAAKAQGTWDKFRKERDFHRMHHRRVVQEKNKLTHDLARLRKHYLSFKQCRNHE